MKKVIIGVLCLVNMFFVASCGKIKGNMLNAQASSASFQGRNLLMAIIEANVTRESLGLASIWPRTKGVDVASAGEKDISEMSFKSAPEYFKVLFDVKNMESKEGYEPYVSVAGFDVSKYAKSGFTDWIIAANIEDKYSDSIPVLISSNVDPAVLKKVYDGQGSIAPISFGSKIGRKTQPWHDNFVVVIYKRGSVAIFQKRDFTYRNLYKESFSLPNLEYLDIK